MHALYHLDLYLFHQFLEEDEELSYFLCILSETDVLYMTRIQQERFEDEALYEKMKGVYVISKDTIVGKCKENMIILHPLPRIDEIDIDLDDTKHALYFKQAKNGVPIREAMIGTALGKLDINYKEKKQNEIIKNKERVCSNNNCITAFEQTDNKVEIINGRKYCYYCGKEI